MFGRRPVLSWRVNIIHLLYYWIRHRKIGSVGIVGLLILLSGCAGLKKTVQLVPEVPSFQRPIRVALATQSGSHTLKFATPVKIHVEEAVYIFDASVGPLTVQLDPKFLELRSPKRYLRFPAPYHVRFSWVMAEDRIQWDGKAYPGNLELLGDETDCAAVLQLPVELYLQGVLPAEMPSHQAEYLEALKAQAVAARTYAYWRMEHPRHRWFDIFSDVKDQVMGAFDDQRQTKWVQQAVQQTAGLVLSSGQNGNTAVAAVQYHSTCGGVFEVKTLPPVDSIRTYRDGNSSLEFCRISPLYRWVRIVQAEALLENLVRSGFISRQQARELQDKGFTMRLTVLQRDASGRAEQLRISIGDTDYAVAGFKIRVILGEEGAPLPSNYFFLLPRPGSQNQFYIFGAGFGHGKGMCQWGAIGQALEGRNWQQILKFYYPMFTLTQRDALP